MRRMKMTPRKELVDLLDSLKNEVLRMGSEVEDMVNRSVKALVDQNDEEARAIIDNDDNIDYMCEQIEDKCIRLSATQAPLAGDLRIVFSLNKIATDLERIADLACGISKYTLHMSGETYIKPLLDIPKMANITTQMLNECLSAFVNDNIELVREIYNKDKEVDGLFDQVFRELLTYAMEKPGSMNQVMNLVFVARNLERIGDHVTNVCEWTYYYVTGRRLITHNKQ